MLKNTIVFFFLLLIALITWTWKDYQNSISRVAVKKPTLIEIRRGDSFNSLVNQLKKKDVSIKSLWFKIFAYRSKVTDKIKTGEYDLPKGFTAQQILEHLVNGKTRHYSITFPEGWNFSEVLQKIKENSNLVHTLDYQSLDHSALMKMLGSQRPHPEGLFFPDTYFFEKNATDLTLLQRAYDKMQYVLTREWADREKNLPLKTPYEALILASIVEKETAIETERPLIAGVFVRRLRTEMLLQTDPTVIYGMGEKYKGNIRIKDLRTRTDYNTYIIKGLPPTPIAMPGREAIHAVLHPEPGESLYFVAKGDGSHIFSNTLKQHNRAVDTFQRKLK